MEVLPTLLARNNHFVSSTFNPNLHITPTLRTLLITCLDPRLHPHLILGLDQSDAAVIQNVGGRLTDDIVRTLLILQRVGRANGGRGLGVGWNIVFLHHTDCGITRAMEPPQLLEQYLGLEAGGLHEHGVTDPRVSVKVDVAALKAHPLLPGGYMVSGCVYDTATGRVEVVVQPEQVPERQ